MSDISTITASDAENRQRAVGHFARRTRRQIETHDRCIFFQHQRGCLSLFLYALTAQAFKIVSRFINNSKAAKCRKTGVARQTRARNPVGHIFSEGLTALHDCVLAQASSTFTQHEIVLNADTQGMECMFTCRRIGGVDVFCSRTISGG